MDAHSDATGPTISNAAKSTAVISIVIESLDPGSFAMEKGALEIALPIKFRLDMNSFLSWPRLDARADESMVSAGAE
jgi:hypothetical protein